MLYHKVNGITHATMHVFVSVTLGWLAVNLVCCQTNLGQGLMLSAKAGRIRPQAYVDHRGRRRQDSAKNGHSGSRLATLVVARKVQSLGRLIDQKRQPNPVSNQPIRCDGSTLISVARA